jgi:hypothetical protein
LAADDQGAAMNENQELSASRKRAVHPAFVPTFSLGALRTRLPLRFPGPEGVPPSPKRHYRSEYRYLGYADLACPSSLVRLILFEIVLRLIDFSALRDYLAHHYYVASAKGQVPFDPVSLFLCVCLRRELGCGWRTLAKLLAGEHGAGWRRLFGFREGDTPSASGLRYFFHTIGPAVFEELCPLFIDLLHLAGLLPEHSTFPGDPLTRGVSISHDIMLHEARSRMRCGQVTDTCYQTAPRPCPAQAKGKEGCDCADPVCALACRRTTPLDPEARLIHYAGRNKRADLPDQPPDQGRDVYGYASNPDRLLDDRFACAWTVRTALHAANSDERSLFPRSFAQLRARFPYLKLGEVLADAALGYQDCLDPIWEAGALRMVDIRAAKGDDDRLCQLQRGYDHQGHPLCIHGYPMRSNGHDYRRRRTKWCCHQVCLTGSGSPQASGSQPQPLECPYQAAQHPYGQVVNVGRTLPDGSVRLAREVPYGSPTWKRRYGRRNLSESRNSSLEHLGLKRMDSYGLTRGRQENAIVDFLNNLRTLGRLVQEATSLAFKHAAS